MASNQSRRRKQERAERRRQDQELVPAAVAKRLSTPAAELAQAMRAAGTLQALTAAEADSWVRDPGVAPEWFTALVAERLARAARAEYRRQQEAEQRAMRWLVAEQSAWEKIEAGKRRFTDDESELVDEWAFRAAKELVRCDQGDITDRDARVLRAAGVDPDDHSTWPLHVRACDGEGAEHCSVRVERMREARRAESLIESVEKETVLHQLALEPGQTVTTWDGTRIAVVVKVNKVTVKVRYIANRGIVEKNIDPRYIQPPPVSLLDPPVPGETVVLRDRGGHMRTAEVVAVDGPLFEATYSIKSGQWRSSWFDVSAIDPGSRQDAIANAVAAN